MGTIAVFEQRIDGYDGPVTQTLKRCFNHVLEAVQEGVLRENPQDHFSKPEFTQR